MRLRVIVTLAMALTLAAGSAYAQNGSIGLFFDPAGATCSATQTPFAPGTIYVLAVLSGDSGSGVTGAEFRVDGVPAAWFPSATGRAGSTTVGNPLTGGCNIAFVCDTGSGGVVLLYTINYFVTSLITDVIVRADRHTTPSNPNFICPLVTLCDFPQFSARCVRAGEAFINHGPCTVGTESTTWSKVKNLYN